VYPFERFTEASKRVLKLAQEETERTHNSFIGTEHLLLALLRERDTVAGEALRRLCVDIADAREIIGTTGAASERIIPTWRVKNVIEMSFKEARVMGDGFVGTEHLLLGLLVEGEGIAAHVLQDLGASLDKVRTEIDAVRKAGTIVEFGGVLGSSTYRAFAQGHPAASPSSGLRLVLFERAGETKIDTIPVYVNPVDVVRVDQVSEDLTSITLRHDESSTLVVRGPVNEVARRLTEP
jgi:ATP-dependent Clp protease ATP-binding subunit ClpA